MAERKVCGTCLWSKKAKHRASRYTEYTYWYCSNSECDRYCELTYYTDGRQCEKWEGRLRDAWSSDHD